MATPSSKLRVLVIDDDPVMRELLSAVLSADGHSIETAEDGESALRELRGDATQDVILTDMQLPGLAGAGLAAALRAAEPDATLLAMSASQPSQEARRAFDGFLLKPFSPADFAASVSAATQPGSATSVVSAASTDPAKNSALDENTYARLAQSLAPTQLAELYSLTLQDVHFRLASMQEALKTSDLDTYRREAHALKGGCSMVGATELARLAAAAEFAEGAFAETPTSERWTFAAEQLRSILAARLGRAM